MALLYANLIDVFIKTGNFDTNREGRCYEDIREKTASHTPRRKACTDMNPMYNLWISSLQNCWKQNSAV